MTPYTHGYTRIDMDSVFSILPTQRMLDGGRPQHGIRITSNGGASEVLWELDANAFLSAYDAHTKRRALEQ